MSHCFRTLIRFRANFVGIRTSSLGLLIEKQRPKCPGEPLRVRPRVEKADGDLLAGDAVDDVEGRLGRDGLVDAEAREDPLDRRQDVLFLAQVQGTLGEHGVDELELGRNLGSGIGGGGGGGLVNPLNMAPEMISHMCTQRWCSIMQ